MLEVHNIILMGRGTQICSSNFALTIYQTNFTKAQNFYFCTFTSLRRKKMCFLGKTEFCDAKKSSWFFLRKNDFFSGKTDASFISSGKLDELLMQPEIYQNAQKNEQLWKLGFCWIMVFRETHVLRVSRKSIECTKEPTSRLLYHYDFHIFTQSMIN